MRSILFTLCVLVCASRAHAQTVKFLDTFTNSGAAEILSLQTNHTTNTGASPFWAEIVDSDATESFRADASDFALSNPGGASARLIWAATPSTALSSADYDVQASLQQILSGQADDDPVCLHGRITDSTHWYAVCLDGENDPRQYRILIANGSNSGLTPLKTGTITPSTNDIIRLSMRGDTIKFYAGATGTTQIDCVVDATLTGAGQGGIGEGNFVTANADVTVAWHLDDFTITDQTGQGGDDDCGAGASRQLGAMIAVGVGE